MAKIAVIFSLALMLAACSQKKSPAPLDLDVSLDTRSYPQALFLTVDAIPNDPNAIPFMNGWPRHERILLDGEQRKGLTDPRQPQVFVLPVQAYSQIFSNAERVEFMRQLQLLKRLTLRGETRRPTTPIPLFPVFATPEAFHVREQVLATPQFEGIRFISRLALNSVPTSNSNIFYSFQGMTSDGRFYISAYLPVSVKGLPPTAFQDQSMAYIEQAKDTQFNPALKQLDDLVDSIIVKEKVAAPAMP